jgi:hypothetical protein
MMKGRKLMEEGNPRHHPIMKLLMVCHLLQWGGL